MYRKISLFLLCFAFASALFAQAPQGFSYQAIARNTIGTVLSNQNVSLRFTIHDATASGTVLYKETASATTNSLGLFTLTVGQGTPVTGTFASIPWAGSAKFMQVELDPAGGSSYSDMGTQQLMSVPFAMYAASSNVPNGTAVGDMLYWNGTSWGSIPGGFPGQILQLSTANIPTWSNGVPVVAMTPFTAVDNTSATAGGSVIADGGSNIVAKGLCWSTSPNPTISNTITNQGPGTNAFSAQLTGLTPNTKYYVRAYVTTAFGTTYSSTQTLLRCTLGGTYGGGVVVRLLFSNQAGYDIAESHGVIAAATDLSSGSAWYNGTFVNCGTGISLTTIQNNNNILNVQGAGTYAASLCTNSLLNGYTDWYLPSLDDLSDIYTQRSFFTGLSGTYWSSSEYLNSPGPTTLAWIENLGNGSGQGVTKDQLHKVKPVRFF